MNQWEKDFNEVNNIVNNNYNCNDDEIDELVSLFSHKALLLEKCNKNQEALNKFKNI